jgi:ribosomal protein S18 acetylase RimI-like enzyme
MADVDAPQIRSATASDIEPVSLMLARAFADDPVKLFLVGGKQLAPERVAPFFRVMQTIQLPHGHVYTTDDHAAAALWSPPGAWKIPVSAIARHAGTLLKLYGWRFLPNLTVLNDMEKHHPPEPHYYLEIIGTDPDQQGRGLGTALMTPMLERADREGVGAYLESTKESNLAFYARFGFTVTKELKHRRKGPVMWLMWRDPR